MNPTEPAISSPITTTVISGRSTNGSVSLDQRLALTSLTTSIHTIPPPTPSPSPRPSKSICPDRHEPALIRDVRQAFQQFDTSSRNRLLAELLSCCDVETLLHVSNLIAPRIKRDFLKDLPTEISLHILSFIHDPQTLAHASMVSRFWNLLLSDEYTWKSMCKLAKFCPDRPGAGSPSTLCGSPRARVVRRLSMLDSDEERKSTPALSDSAMDVDNSDDPFSSDGDELVENMRALCPLKSCVRSDCKSHSRRRRINGVLKPPPFSFRQHYKACYLTESNWKTGGRVLRSHSIAEGGTVTNVSIDSEWILVSLTSRRIQVFSAETGELMRTLVGHSQGVWALHLVSKGGQPTPAPTPTSQSPVPRSSSSSPSFLPASSSSSLSSSSSASVSGLGLSGTGSPNESNLSPLSNSGESTSTPLPPNLTQSDVCNASYGWGNEGALALSGSCDRDIRVWDVRSGYCLHVLKGHSATVRCIKALDGRPIAVSGARDGDVRVWDVQKGMCLRVLEGHGNSVRSLDVAGNVAVSGSYDHTAKLWNVDTGECMRTFRGHTHQVYAVAFDGKHVATGSLDSTVRLWDAESGNCLALLQGHTSLVGHLQILDGHVVTGGADGRVIIFSLRDYQTVLRICAHDNSITTLQLDKSYLVTGANDGCVKLFERETGTLVRELTARCECVWKVMMRRDKCVIMCKRGGRTVVEVLSFAPTPDQL